MTRPLTNLFRGGSENRLHARIREPLSIALIVLGSLALLAAALSYYAENNLFDPARFADRAEVALESDAVRDVAAEQITRQIIEQVDPDIAAITPIVSAATAAIIDTTAFERLFRSSVLELQQAAVNGHLSNTVVVIANIGVLVKEALKKVSPGIAQQIPDQLDADLIQVARGDIGRPTSRAVEINDWLHLLLPLLVLLLFAGAVAMSTDRRRALARCGISIAVSGAALAAVYLLTRTYVIHQFHAGVKQTAAGDVFEAFFYDLLLLAGGIAVAGTALAAAASGSLRTVNVDRRVRQIANRLISPPSHLGWRAAWAVLMVALGVATLIDPLAMVWLVAVLIGFYLLFRGFNELVAMAMPVTSSRGGVAATTSPGDAPGRSGAPIGRAIAGIALVLIVGVAIGTALLGSSGLQQLGVVDDSLGCNGSIELCDRPFNQVAFAATHNSMSDLTYPGWLFGEQDGPISAQLSSGIRGLLIDAYYGYPGQRVYTADDRSSPSVRRALVDEFGREFVSAADRIRRSIARPRNKEKQIYLCHGFCEMGALPIGDAFRQVRQFLERNPRQVIVLVVEDYITTADLAKTLADNGLDKYAYRGSVEKPWPTLREMIDRGERIVVMAENHSSAKSPWIHPAYDVMQETPYSFSSPRELKSRKSCRPNRGDPDNSIFLINHWIEARPNPRPSIARRVNKRSFLGKRVALCEKIRGIDANVVAVDFYKQGDVVSVVDALNAGR